MLIISSPTFLYVLQVLLCEPFAHAARRVFIVRTSRAMRISRTQCGSAHTARTLHTFYAHVERMPITRRAHARAHATRTPRARRAHVARTPRTLRARRARVARTLRAHRNYCAARTFLFLGV